MPEMDFKTFLTILSIPVFSTIELILKILVA